MVARARLLFALSATLVFALSLASRASAGPPAAGGVFQLPAPAGCFTDTGNSGTCTPVSGSASVDGAEGIAVAPDGTQVFVANDNGSTIGVFTRNASTGALTPGTGLYSLGQFTDVGVSADGRNIYATTRNGGTQNGGLSAWQRDPATGDTGFINCVAENTTNSNCSNGAAGTTGLDDAASLAVSPQAVYVAGPANGGSLTVFFRDHVTGRVGEVECLPQTVSGSGTCASTAIPQSAGVDAVAVTPDGGTVYAVGSFNGGAVVGYNRLNSGPAVGAIDPATPVISCISSGSAVSGCDGGAKALGGLTNALAVSPDSRDVYVGGFNAGFSTYRRDPSTGVLTFHQCFTGTSTAGCTQIAAIGGSNDVRQVAVSPDGRFVYMTADPTYGDGAVFAFARDPATGTLTKINCVNMLGGSGCTAGDVLSNTEGVVVSPGDGRNVYVAAFDGTASGSGALDVFGAQLAPSCQSAAVTVAAGASVTLPLTCTDANGDAVTRAISSGPSHGTLGAVNNSAGSVSYTPAAGYSGADAITYTGSDGTNSSAPATVSITVTGTTAAAAGASPGGAAAPNLGSFAATLPPVTFQTIGQWLRDIVRTVSGGGIGALNGVGVTLSPTEPGTATVSFFFGQPPAQRATAARKKGKKKPTATLIASGQRVFAAPGPGTVTVRLTSAGRKAVAHAKSIKLTLLVRFAPASGRKPIVGTQSVTLKKSKKKH